MKKLDAIYEAVANAIDTNILIVNQLAEEYNNGWIPCEKKLPETNESVLCWAKSTARGGDVCFVGSYHKGFGFCNRLLTHILFRDSIRSLLGNHYQNHLKQAQNNRKEQYA